MNNLNYVFVEGTLTHDPEFRMLTADTPVCRFSIAVNRYYKKKGNDDYTEDTSYFFVESWGTAADNVKQFLEKGRKVRVIGRLKQARWLDSSDPERPRERTYIVADHIEFGSQKHPDIIQNEKNDDAELMKNLDVDASEAVLTEV